MNYDNDPRHEHGGSNKMIGCFACDNPDYYKKNRRTMLTCECGGVVELSYDIVETSCVAFCTECNKMWGEFGQPIQEMK